MGWLYRIMVNTHISAYRRQQHRPTLQFTDEFTDGQLLAHSQRGSSATRSTEELAIAHTGDPAIAAAMRSLPEKYRTAIYYADIEGRKFREIALLTNVPIGTVMSRLHRGRKQLRDALSAVDLQHLGNPSPIVPVRVGDEALARLVSRRLPALAVIANLVEFPAVAKGDARLRLQMMPTHSLENVQALASRLRTAIDLAQVEYRQYRGAEMDSARPSLTVA